MINNIAYKLSKSVFPCVMLTLCIGFCYAFSLFIPHIVETIGCTVTQARFAFCLNIFFLGMGAACFGPLAERHIRLSALASSVLLVLGLAVSGLACHFKSLWLLYLGSGVLCGISEGSGYVTPNKNMLLWFPNSKFKGILTAISIFTFGLGSSLCACLFGLLIKPIGIENTFYALAAIYAVPMAVSTLLINKPRYALIELKKTSKSEFSYLQTMKNGYFQKCWLFMFINISMGLVLIGTCATLLSELGFSNSTIVLLMMLCGVFNGAGRLVFPMIGDLLVNRSIVWFITAAFELVLMIPIILAYAQGVCVLLAAICIVLIHAGYGSAFACLPSILADHFGKKQLSQLHGFCLTSWGMASLMAFVCSTFVLKCFSGYMPMMVVVFFGYMFNTIVSSSIATHTKNESDIP